MATEKLYIVTETGTQTITNKTISAGNNTIAGIDTSNLATKTSTDAGKSFVVDSDGSWKLAKINGYSPDETTIDLNASSELEVKDGGLTVAKFDATAISTAIGATAVDTKVTTENAVKTYADAFAKSLEFTMDATSFVLTAVLKDASGTALSTQTVDLPLEQMVVNVEYDNTNQRFVITLKDGSKIYIPATDILRGVVTENATQTLTNKTIDCASNTISNIELSNLKANVLQTTVRASSSATDTSIASEKAVATAVEARVPYDSSATDKTFTVGYDASGYYLVRETA